MIVSDEDDLGMPEHPIYSNYPKHLWKSHVGRRINLATNKPRQSGEATPLPQDDALPAIVRLAPVAAVGRRDKRAA